MADTNIFTVRNDGLAIGIGCEPRATGSKFIQLGEGWTAPDAPYTYGSDDLEPDTQHALSYLKYAQFSATYTVPLSKYIKQSIRYANGLGLDLCYGTFHRLEIPISIARNCPHIEWGTPEIYSTMWGYEVMNEANLRKLANFTSPAGAHNVAYISVPFTLELNLYTIAPALRGKEILRQPVVSHAFNSNFDFETGDLACMGELTYAIPSYNGVHNEFMGLTTINDILDDFPNRIGDADIKWGDTLLKDSGYTSGLMLNSHFYQAEKCMTTYYPVGSVIASAYPWNAAAVLAAYPGDSYVNSVLLAEIPIVVDWRDGFVN